MYHCDHIAKICLLLFIILDFSSLVAQQEVELHADGVVIPRVDRTLVTSPGEGQLVYDVNTNSFWVYDGSEWQKVGYKTDRIIDDDEDTEIVLVESAEGDEIQFKIEGVTAYRFIKDTAGFSRIEVENDDFTGNTFFGWESGEVNESNSNTFFGAYAGKQNTTGKANTFFGRSAGILNQTGSCNSFFGSLAGRLTVGNNNSFFGKHAGYENTLGDWNVFLGANAGNENVTGSNNVMIGYFAGGLDTNAMNSIYIGHFADMGGPFTTSPTVGRSGNICIGYLAGSLENGSNRLYIENSAAEPSDALIFGKFDTDELSFNAKVGIGTTDPLQVLDVVESAPATGTVIWHENSAPAATTNSVQLVHRLNTDTQSRSAFQIVSSFNSISDASRNSLVRFQSFNNGFFNDAIKIDGDDVSLSGLVGAGTADVQVDANGQLMRAASDLRLKEDIQPIKHALQKVKGLRGVSYLWKTGPNLNRALGVVAQEVMEVLPDVVTSDGEYYGVNYSELPALLIEAVKEQQQEIEILREELRSIKAMLQIEE